MLENLTTITEVALILGPFVYAIIALLGAGADLGPVDQHLHVILAIAGFYVQFWGVNQPVLESA